MVSTFWACEKRLISKFLTSQLGQTMKFGQLVAYNKSNKSLQNQTSPRPISVFKRASGEVKASGQHFSFNIFQQSSAGIYNENKLYKISDC